MKRTRTHSAILSRPRTWFFTAAICLLGLHTQLIAQGVVISPPRAAPTGPAITEGENFSFSDKFLGTVRWISPIVIDTGSQGRRRAYRVGRRLFSVSGNTVATPSHSQAGITKQAPIILTVRAVSHSVNASSPAASRVALLRDALGKVVAFAELTSGGAVVFELPPESVALGIKLDVPGTQLMGLTIQHSANLVLHN